MSSANLLQNHEPIGRPRCIDIEQIAVVLLRQVDVGQNDGGRLEALELVDYAPTESARFVARSRERRSR